MWASRGHSFPSGNLYLNDLSMARLVVEIEHVKKLCVQNVDVIPGSIVNRIASMGPTITEIEI